MTLRVLPLAVVLAAAMSLTGLAMAATDTTPAKAPVVRNGDELELDLVGHKLSVPLPDWLTDADKGTTDISSVVETAFVGGAAQAQVEWFPKGESQINWTKRYGVQLLLQDAAPLTRFRDISMRSFAATCPKANIAFFQTEADQGETLPPLGFVCAGYGATDGPLAGLGEVALLAFRKTDKGVSLIYEDWRGPAFDASKPATWPITTDALQVRSDQFKSAITLTPAD